MAASKVKTKWLNITGTPTVGQVPSFVDSESMVWVNQTSTAALPWKLIAYTAIFDGKSFVLNT